MTASDGLAQLNKASKREARTQLERCCGASRWVSVMLALRPFGSREELLERAAAIWKSLDREDFLEAFSHHPEIGADLGELRKKFASTADLASAEQSGAAGASDAVLLALREKNEAYRERFGYTFIVCASGKSADEMLALLEARLENSEERELSVAAEEQQKITRLRLEKLVG